MRPPVARGLFYDRRFQGAVVLFVLLAVVYAGSIDLRATREASITADEPFYLLTTQSLIEDRDLDLRQQYERHSYRAFFDHPDGLWRQSVPLDDGRVLSPHEPGLSILLIPAFTLGGLMGTQIQMMVIAATTFAAAFVLTALETRAILLSWIVTLAVGVSATAFVYSTEVYPEIPAALCVVLSLLVLRRAVPGVREAVLLSMLLAALLWLGMKYAPVGIVIGLWFLWRANPRLRIIFLALSAASGLTYISGHLYIFGALTAYNSNTVFEGASTFDVLRSHVEVTDRVYRLWGLFVDRRFGIGRWAPVLLPVLPALPLLIRRGRVGSVIFTLIVVQMLVAAFLAITMMGFWFAGRMLVVVLPLFAVVLAHLAVRLSLAGLMAGGVLAAYSAVTTALLFVAAHREEITLAVDPFDMSATPFQVVAPLFPDYRAWTFETNLLTAVWLALGMVTLFFVLRTRSSRPPEDCVS